MRRALRINGIYRWRGGEYAVIDMSRPEARWASLGLIGHPFQYLASDINYIRTDGTIIDIMFTLIGSDTELVDTERSISS